MESMGEPCRVTSAYPYEPKHDPFVYFDDINGWDGLAFGASTRCAEHVVDYGQLARDLAAGTVPKYAFITPNMQHDMHDGSIADGDAWLAAELPAIFASPAYQDGGVVFLTWDEGSDQEDDPPMIVISPHARHGFVSNTEFNASSYLKTVQRMLGVEALPCDPEHQASVATMDELFDVSLAAVDVAGAAP
jgi:phospholipase C